MPHPAEDDRRVPSNSFLARLLTIENVITLCIYCVILAGNWASLSAQVNAAQEEAERANRTTERILRKLEDTLQDNMESRSATDSRLSAIETDIKWIRLNLEK